MNFQKFQLKLKNVLHFTRPIQRSALRKLFSHPHQRSHPLTRSYYFCGTKIFLRRDTEIYRHLTSKCFKNCCSSWESRNKTAPFLQLFFLKPNRNVFAGKFVKSKRVLARLWEHVIFNIIEVEVHHMNEVF